MECKTPTDDRSRRFGVPNYSPPNYLCLRRCKENAKQREKHKVRRHTPGSLKVPIKRLCLKPD